MRFHTESHCVDVEDNIVCMKMDWLRRLRGGTTTCKRRTSTWPNLSCSKYFMNPSQRAIITVTSYISRRNSHATFSINIKTFVSTRKVERFHFLSSLAIKLSVQHERGACCVSLDQSTSMVCQFTTHGVNLWLSVRFNFLVFVFLVQHTCASGWKRVVGIINN